MIAIIGSGKHSGVVEDSLSKKKVKFLNLSKKFLNKSDSKLEKIISKKKKLTIYI